MSIYDMTDEELVDLMNAKLDEASKPAGVLVRRGYSIDVQQLEHYQGGEQDALVMFGTATKTTTLGPTPR